MPNFRYSGRNSNRQLVEGTIEAADRSSAIHLIEKTGCTPLRVELIRGKEEKESAQKPAVAAMAATAASAPAAAAKTDVPVGRVSHAQRLLFTEQLAYLLMTNMNLDQALGVLARRLKQPALHRLTQSLHQALVDGKSFSQALAEHPKIFSSLYINLAQAGEASGALAEVLSRLVKHLTEMKQVRDRVQQALIYPAFLAFIGVVLVTIFITVMVPQLTELFRTAGGELPLATRLLIEAHDVIVKYWWIAVILVGVIWFSYKGFVKTPAGRMNFDRFKLSIPGYGQVLSYRFFSQFARTLNTLLSNGVNLLRSLELLEDVAENTYITSKLKVAKAAVVEGSSLSNALGKQGIFPGMFIDMVAVGEQAGRLAETTGMIADIYERELDRRIKIASALVPPVIIVVIAVLVGAVVFGILSAVFSLTSNLKMH